MENYNQQFDMPSAIGQAPIDIVPPVTFMGEVSVEPGSAVGVIEEALTLVRDNLTEFAASETFETDMLTVFGESADVELGQTIIEALAVGGELPQINVVPVEQMNGAAGGFDSLTGEVYLADRLISESPLPVADVLTEELGHYIDSQLNRKDAPGDEGALFAALVRGEVLSDEDVGRLKREDDRVRILGGLVEVEADDRFEIANDLGVLARDIVVDDDIGFARGRIRDTRDYYRFELREESEVALFLSQLRGDANLTLYDDGRVRIFESRNSGREDEIIEAILDAGVYYLEVSSAGPAQTQYSLDLSASEVIIDPDSTPELANNIGRLTQEKRFQKIDTIGFTSGSFSRDSQDWYRFELEGESEVTLFLGQLRGDADLRLYDDGRTLMFQSRNPGRANEAIEAILDAGVYYLQVFPVGNDRTDYTLGASIQTQDTTPPEISIGNTSIVEGNRGSTNAQFTVTLDDPIPEIVKVNYNTANQTAIANQDYKPTKGTLTFSPGQTTKTITVPILGDTQIEPDEKFQLKLSNPSNAKLKDKRGIATIANDDIATDKPQPKISIGDTKITEGNQGSKNAKFQVTLDAKPEETVTVNYATANKTAIANQDYKPTKGKLTFKPGQTRKTITVPILGDTKIENNETFNLNLSNPKNAQLKDKRGISTIRDNDFATLSIKDTQITEGDSGKKQAKFTVALNAKINERVQVNYATSDGTAKQGSDYQKTQGKLTFKPNQTRKTITIPILGDTFNEDSEKFSVQLSKPSKNVKLGDKRAIGTIKDNDAGGDKPGDSFQAAINLGKLTEEQVMVDEIGFTEAGDRDTNDFYRFQTDKEGTFVLFLDDLLKDANVDLYGSGEELINQSKNDGTQRESIVTILDPGSYYVRVYPQGGDRTTYRLSIDLI